MGRVVDELTRLLENQVDKAGIVVWYDPEGHYGTVVPELTIEKTEIVAFEDSYFEIRQKVEPLMGTIDRPRIVVYVNAARHTRMPPLVELEKAGIICEPGAATGRNTKLEVIARTALKNENWLDDKIKDELANITKGYHGLAEIEQIIEQGSPVGTESSL